MLLKADKKRNEEREKTKMKIYKVEIHGLKNPCEITKPNDFNLNIHVKGTSGYLASFKLTADFEQIRRIASYVQRECDGFKGTDENINEYFDVLTRIIAD